jgi:hypothetical protein
LENIGVDEMENIKICLIETEWEGVDWINLDQGRV